MSDPLCEICEGLDIANVFRQEYSTIVIDDIELGTVADIRERGEVCTLCSIIKQELEKETCEGYDNCFLRRNIYCTIWAANSKEQLGANTTAVDPHDSEGKRIMRYEVMLAPAVTTGFMGPLLPFGNRREVIEKTRPRGLLQFQELEIQLDLKSGADSEQLFQARGRAVNSKEVNLKLVANWLRICEDSHGQLCCKDPWTDLTAAIDGLLLIDVDTSCIVDAPAECRYVALSYCWGDALTVKHTKQNSTRLRKPKSLINASIPATVRDAMLVTASLKERYLWVDALCIVQDDPVASQQQLSQMGEIYSQALLTIIAAAGPRADSGLPGIHNGSRNVSRSSLKLDKLYLTTVVDKSDDFGSISQTDWSTRAWTMQEKLLSQRRLIFTKDQVYWRCRSSTWLEEVRLEDTTAQRFFMGVSKPGEIDEITLENAHRFFMGVTKPGETDDSRSTLELESEESRIFKLHSNLVGTYLRRHLGYHSDSLNAFSGILHILSNLYRKESFVWGLLESQFSSALNWSFRGGGMRNNAFTSFYSPNSPTAKFRFPSWSWSSCAGGLNDLWYNTSKAYKEISFYRQGLHGQLLPIQEPSSQTFTDKTETVQRWKGTPQTIESALTTFSPPQSFVDTGTLVFYSSTAPCTIYRYAVPDIGLAGYDRGHFMRLETAWDKQVPHRWINIYDLLDEDLHPWKPNTEPVTSGATENLSLTIGMEASKVLTDPSTDVLLDASVVILGRKDAKYLIAFIVRFDEDGVAFRIGLAEIWEALWNDVDNREWRMVRLQ